LPRRSPRREKRERKEKKESRSRSRSPKKKDRRSRSRSREKARDRDGGGSASAPAPPPPPPPPPPPAAPDLAADLAADLGLGDSSAATAAPAKRKRRAMWDVDAAGQKSSAPVVSPAAAMTAGLLQLQEQALITRKVRCLHVGNVPGTATPERLRDFVNCLMVRDDLAMAPSGPSPSPFALTLCPHPDH